MNGTDLLRLKANLILANSGCRASLMALCIVLAACASGGTPEDEIVVIDIEAPGATSEHIERAVTIPLERALGTMAGVASIRSDTFDSHCRFEVGFELMSAAEMVVRVRAALISARPVFELPVENETVFVRSQAPR